MARKPRKSRPIEAALNITEAAALADLSIAEIRERVKAGTFPHHDDWDGVECWPACNVWDWHEAEIRRLILELHGALRRRDAGTFWASEVGLVKTEW